MVSWTKLKAKIWAQLYCVIVCHISDISDYFLRNVKGINMLLGNKTIPWEMRGWDVYSLRSEMNEIRTCFLLDACPGVLWNTWVCLVCLSLPVWLPCMPRPQGSLSSPGMAQLLFFCVIGRELFLPLPGPAGLTGTAVNWRLVGESDLRSGRREHTV